MKKKNDDLLRLAFGELSADEARSIEARAAADPSVRKELQVCQELRASLQHLPPPPPDGLSAERLRAAILDRELSARRPAFSWNWAPVALAALAVVVFIARPAHRSEPQVVAMSSPVGSSTFRDRSLEVDGALRLQTRVVGPSVEKAMNAASLAAPVVPAVSHRNTERRSVESNRPKIAWTPSPLFVSHEAEEPGVKFAMMTEIDSPASSVGAPENGKKSSKDGGDTVVIVSNKRDLDTGAAAASETEADHVLVGG